jgi:eukaryotic-like serine/threonine-protein kinase
MSDEANKQFGDYQILSELGSGGMGRVYRVRNVITDRIEAMKVLLPDLAGRQELAARFQREIKVLASLNHPNIAQLRTALVVDNQLVMIMEYVEGTTLADRLDRGPIPVPDAVNYIDQVLNALSYAHQQHVIHRDIKPVNMMLTPQGVVKLMDFGIARSGEERSLTMTGTTLGSLNYMSPEQVKGETTDNRSDLYSVGVSLYEMVTGRKPFQAESDYSIMTAHVNDKPKAPVELQPGLPSTLNEIILIAISKDPAQRFQTADAFRNALSSVHGGATSSTVAVVAPSLADPDVTAPTLASPKLSTPAPAVTPIPTPVPSPAATPTVLMPPPQAASHRGLYMTLGALMVLVVLVAAGIYVPRHSKTEAKNTEMMSPPPSTPAVTPSPKDQPAPPVPAPQSEAQPSVVPDNSAAQPAGITATAPATPQPPSSIPDSTPKQAAQTIHDLQPKAAAKPKLSARNQAGSSHEMSLPASADSQPPESASIPAAKNTAELDELEHEVDQLSTRAAAVNSGLDRLQQQQAASGYGLRGDMVAKQASLKNNLAKAQDAVEHGDVERAKKYSSLAQADAEALEHFLGR